MKPLHRSTFIPQKTMKVLQKFANARNFLTTKAFLTESSLAMDITNKIAPFSETLKWGHCDSSSNTT